MFPFNSIASKGARSILYLFFLAGSIFITSGHFVNTFNAPKYYIFAACIFCLGIVSPWFYKKVALPFFSSVLTPFFIVGLLYMLVWFSAFNAHWVNIIVVLLLALWCLQINGQSDLRRWMLVGFVGLGTALAAYGLLQYARWLPRPAGFAMSGAFDNPAGFAAALALLFPAGLYLVLAEKHNNYLRFLTGTE